MIFGRWALVPIILLVSTTSARAQSLDERANRRAQLEQRFRQRFSEVVQGKVGLNEDQMRRLMESNRRFESRRRDLLLEERRVRVGLRDELKDGATPDEERVRRLLDDALRLQRERADLLIEEQTELSAFMTPVQRARYFGLQDQIRRKVDELRSPTDDVEGDSMPSGRRDHMRRRPRRVP